LLSPQGSELRAIQAMIAQEGFFDLLHLQRVLALQELTVSSSVPLTRQIAASVFRLGEHGQAFRNRLLIVPFAVKESAARRGWDFLAGRALLHPLETSLAYLADQLWNPSEIPNVVDETRADPNLDRPSQPTILHGVAALW
jgi:hypothetical protein